MAIQEGTALDLIGQTPYVPEVSADTLPGSSPEEARNPGGDSENSERCDDSDGANVNENIVYLPRERFRPGADGCRATGIVGYFTDAQDVVGGTGTSVSQNFEKWRREDPSCQVPEVTPPDYERLPRGRGARARGHLAGCQFGGSGTDLRNLVPLHGAANMPAMSTIEGRVATQIRAGQRVHYAVTPIYHPIRVSGVPAFIHIQARGNRGMNVDCYIRNVASRSGSSPVCLSETYRRPTP
ncbi:DNA/RNA non-specific endonuclease [Streptomyces hainanensis]|uniref:Type VII secretion system protein EssD-like domain-containing protein n=1 Tax=Streptomyces hainanensis TaxID=402648 RepID=A0A4R4SG73_9ACTN|nr:hypothetical protein E1283_34135 [Streptomyces hainanensis]